MKIILSILFGLAVCVQAQPTLANSDDIAAAKNRANHTGTQPMSTISDAGTAATTNATDYATAAQGVLAGTALQPADIASGTITPKTGALDFNSLGAPTNASVNAAIDDDPAASRAALEIPSSSGCLIGDSTTATYSGQNGIETYILGYADDYAGSSVTSLAVAGHTIAQQKAAWTADTNKATYDWISVLIGANDMDYTESASTALTRYQDLIDTINAGKKPSAKVIVSAILPMRQRLIDLLGGTNGNTAYAKWQAMNIAILGGSGAITGVDYRISSGSDFLNDGTGRLARAYATLDGIHPTNAGRIVYAAEVVKTIQLAGFMRAGAASGIPYASALSGTTNFLVGNKVQIGPTTTTVSGTATVDALSLGNSYGSNARGSTGNIKVLLYEYLTNKAGIGVHGTGLDFIASTSNEFGWFAGANETMNLSGTGLLRPRIGTYCPTYADDAAADADGALRAGEFYRTTAGGRAVFRKP